MAANAARDLGGRFMVLTIWGKAASGGSYAAVAALTNIPATICGALFYEFVFADSTRGMYLACQSRDMTLTRLFPCSYQP